MKIAYFGYNAFSSCLDLLIQTGHQVLFVFSGEPSQFTDRIYQLAQQHHLPISSDKPDKAQLEKCIEAGVELFIAAEYPWKIPLPKALPYAVNIHPSMLPEGKGPTPLPRILLDFPQHSGITLHQMTEQFDQGDILLQKSIPLDKTESFDTLSAKLYLAAPKLLKQLLDKPEYYFQHASPQGECAAWPALSKQEQKVNWHQPTHKVLKQIRAFGSLGVYAQLADQHFLITTAEGVDYPHQLNPGELVMIDQHRLVMACLNGLISMPRSGLVAITNPN